MKGYDMLEALGTVEDGFIAEAEKEGVLRHGRLQDCAERKRQDAGVKAEGSRRPSWRRHVLKVAAAGALLIALPAATVFAADYFSGLKRDELAFERVEYRGDGIVAIQVQNYSDKVLEFEEDIKLGIFYANKEIPQKAGGAVKMEGNVVAPHSSSELIVDLSGAYDMAIADQPLVDDWYYLVLTNRRFVFGQEWQCAMDFQNVTEEEAVYRAENEEALPEYEKQEMYAAEEVLKGQLADTETAGISAGVFVPVFIAYNGAVYRGSDCDISSRYVTVSDTAVEFNPDYAYTAYQVVGSPELVAILINNRFAVYEKMLDVAFRLDGADYQVECGASYLGRDAAGELLMERGGMKIYQAVGPDNRVIEGKCIVDISELMSEACPELFEGSEEKSLDCLWVAEPVGGK